MPIQEAQVEVVVSEVSRRMGEPDYVQNAVGAFVQAQPHISRYLSARGPKIGGGEAVVHIAFHSEVMAQCLRNHRGRALSIVDFHDLDAAAEGDAPGRFEKQEPALANYVASNIDDEKVRLELCRIGLALAGA